MSKRIDWDCPSRWLASELLAQGFSYVLVERHCHLTKNQVGYHARKQGTYPTDYRNGKTKLARDIVKGTKTLQPIPIGKTQKVYKRRKKVA